MEERGAYLEMDGVGWGAQRLLMTLLFRWYDR